MNKPQKDWDWSAKFSRLRAEMVTLSVLIFAVSQLDIEPAETSLFPFKPASVDIEVILVGSTVWWFIACLHFWARYSSEKQDVTLRLAELREMRGAMKDMIIGVYKDFEKDMGDKVRRIEKVTGEFKEFAGKEALQESLTNVVNAKLSETGRNPRPNYVETLAGSVLDRINAINGIGEKNARRVEAALAELRQDLNKHTNILNETMITHIERSELWFKNVDSKFSSFGIDTIVFGVVVPAAISILLVLPCSVDIANAFVTVSESAASRIKNDFAFIFANPN